MHHAWKHNSGRILQVGQSYAYSAGSDEPDIKIVGCSSHGWPIIEHLGKGEFSDVEKYFKSVLFTHLVEEAGETSLFRNFLTDVDNKLMECNEYVIDCDEERDIGADYLEKVKDDYSWERATEDAVNVITDSRKRWRRYYQQVDEALWKGKSQTLTSSQNSWEEDFVRDWYERGANPLTAAEKLFTRRMVGK